MYLHEYSCEYLLNAFLAMLLPFKINCGRFFFPHTPIRVDKTACFQPISCVCSFCVCQVAFELYHMWMQNEPKVGFKLHKLASWLCRFRVASYSMPLVSLLFVAVINPYSFLNSKFLFLILVYLLSILHFV